MSYLSDAQILRVENSGVFYFVETCINQLNNIATLGMILLAFSYEWNFNEFVTKNRFLIWVIVVGFYFIVWMKDVAFAKLGLALPISRDKTQEQSVLPDLVIIRANQARQERIRARGFDTERLLDENERIYQRASKLPELYLLYCYPLLPTNERNGKTK